MKRQSSENEPSNDVAVKPLKMLQKMNSDVEVELRPSGQSSKANPDVAARLKIAVKRGGGNKAVSKQSGVKLSTLNNYLRQVTRLSAGGAVAIAKACRVSIDWLLTGQGPMEYGQDAFATVPEFGKVNFDRPQASEQRQSFVDFSKPAGPLESSLDLLRLGLALRLVSSARAQPTTAQDWFDYAREVAALYDEVARRDAARSPDPEETGGS